MNSSSKGDASRVTARRRLIRGAFGAPAALTLYSGNVFAASSNLRALSSQLGAPEFPAVVEGNPSDTWIRVRVYKHGNVELVSGTEVAGVPGCGSSFVHAGEWARVDNSQRYVVNDNATSSTEKFAALRFDASGTIVGVSTGTPVGGTTALTRSAGASISLAGGCY